MEINTEKISKRKALYRARCSLKKKKKGTVCLCTSHLPMCGSETAVIWGVLSLRFKSQLLAPSPPPPSTGIFPRVLTSLLQSRKEPEIFTKNLHLPHPLGH